jgi:hypothetical protein
VTGGRLLLEDLRVLLELELAPPATLANCSWVNSLFGVLMLSTFLFV